MLGSTLLPSITPSLWRTTTFDGYTAPARYTIYALFTLRDIDRAIVSSFLPRH
jgi:hypothetical protein